MPTTTTALAPKVPNHNVGRCFNCIASAAPPAIAPSAAPTASGKNSHGARTLATCAPIQATAAAANSTTINHATARAPRKLALAGGSANEIDRLLLAADMPSF